jgi:hypothetical protein
MSAATMREHKESPGYRSAHPGYACFQDWSLAPRHKHGVRADCGEHLLIKRDPKHKARAEQMLPERKTMLVKADKELTRRTDGASNYLDHDRKIVRRPGEGTCRPQRSEHSGWQLDAAVDDPKKHASP